MFDTERETLVYARRNGNLAYWVLDSSWSHELLRTPATTVLNLGSTTSTRPSPGSFPPWQQAHSRRGKPDAAAQFRPQHQVEQTLWAGEALKRYARSQIHRDGLWSAGALGVLLAALYWGLRNYRRSLKDCCKEGWLGGSSSPSISP